jgi:malate permease and related proteins
MTSFWLLGVIQLDLIKPLAPYFRLLMSALLPAILPVSLIIFIGFIAGRSLSLDPITLSQLGVYILAPALVADGLYRMTLSVESAVGLLMGFTIISLLLYAIAWGFASVFRFSPELKKSLIATTLLPNNGNLGLPLIDFALGSAGLERAIVYMLGSSILMFGIAPALLRGHGIGFGMSMTLKLPLIWAMLAGLGLRWLGIKLPFQIDESIRQLGQAAIPIALVVLGIQLASTHFKVGRYELFATAIRLLLAPLVAYGIGRALNLQGLDLQVLILQSAMPAAVNTVILVTEFGGDASRVARTIVVSTLFSFLTLSATLWVSGNL